MNVTEDEDIEPLDLDLIMEDCNQTQLISFRNDIDDILYPTYEGITYDRQKYIYDHSVNNTKKELYISKFTDEVPIKKMFDILKHVSWSEFKEQLLKVGSECFDLVKDTKFSFFQYGREKSNFFFTGIVYNSIFRDKLEPKLCNQNSLIYVDDMSYSGSQLVSMLKKFTSYDKVYICIPYMSQRVYNNLTLYKKFIIPKSVIVVNNLGEYSFMNEVGTALFPYGTWQNIVPIYFDHKLASPLSTISSVLGCGIVPKTLSKENKISIIGNLLNNCLDYKDLDSNLKKIVVNFTGSLYIKNQKYEPSSDEPACIYCPKPIYKYKDSDFPGLQLQYELIHDSGVRSEYVTSKNDGHIGINILY
jgi:hypothetical protein